MANGYQTLSPEDRPQTPEESINLLQSLLAEIIPGWTEEFRDGKTQSNILDSLLYDATGGHPPYISMFGEQEWDYKHRNALHRIIASAGSGKAGLYPLNVHSDPSISTPDTLFIRDLEGVISDLPHILQFRDPNWLKSKEDYTGYDSYTNPGEFEHEAHSIIQPLVEQSFGLLNDKPENYRQNLMETYPKSMTYRINLEGLPVTSERTRIDMKYKPEDDPNRNRITKFKSHISGKSYSSEKGWTPREVEAIIKAERELINK